MKHQYEEVMQATDIIQDNLINGIYVEPSLIRDDLLRATGYYCVLIDPYESLGVEIDCTEDRVYVEAFQEDVNCKATTAKKQANVINTDRIKAKNFYGIYLKKIEKIILSLQSALKSTEREGKINGY